MRRLVGEEGDLREDDAERARDEQLEPAVSEQDETGDRASEGENDAGARCSSPISRTTCETF
jgi:hypothetical protein